MSRNKENIKMQLNRRLNELLRIGQKKQKESRGTPNYNPSRSEGVHSISSADTYRKSLNTFGDYCKTQNIRSIDQIDEKVVEGFLQSRRNLSGHTISKDLSVKPSGFIKIPSCFIRRFDSLKAENITWSIGYKHTSATTPRKITFTISKILLPILCLIFIPLTSALPQGNVIEAFAHLVCQNQKSEIDNRIKQTNRC